MISYWVVDIFTYSNSLSAHIIIYSAGDYICTPNLKTQSLKNLVGKRLLNISNLSEAVDFKRSSY